MRISLFLTALCVSVVSLALTGDSDAQDRARVDRAAIARVYGPVKNLLQRDRDAVDDVVTGIRELDGIIDYETAIDLFSYFEECDTAWESTGRNTRPKEAYKIALAMLATVRRMDHAEEALKFATNKDISNTEKFPLRARMAMLDAIARHASHHEDSMKLLLSLARDSSVDTDIRIISILHLGEHSRSPEVLGTLLATLGDQSWRIRDASIESLLAASRHHEDRVVLAFINALAEETGRLRQTLRDALNRITRANLDADPDEWSDWYRNRKREAEGLPVRRGGDRGTRARVFETDTFSDRYVFIIDTSISMLEKVSEEEMERIRRAVTGPDGERDKREPLDWSKIESKLDLAREEIIRSIKVMDPERTRFTIIRFDTSATAWKEELVPTDQRHIAEATAWLRAIRGGRTTNVFAALDAAYDLSERLAGIDIERRTPRRRNEPVTTGRHRDDALPDTIFLYTDGWATHGKYAGDDAGWRRFTQEEKTRMYHSIMAEMKEEVRDRNRVARIAINAIGIGRPQDHHTLRDLASITGGTYVPIGR